VHQPGLTAGLGTYRKVHVQLVVSEVALQLVMWMLTMLVLLLLLLLPLILLLVLLLLLVVVLLLLVLMLSLVLLMLLLLSLLLLLLLLLLVWRWVVGPLVMVVTVAWLVPLRVSQSSYKGSLWARTLKATSSQDQRLSLPGGG
jgi:hypothetical protein